MAGLATSGTLTHWFRENFAKEIATDAAFATLATEAGSSPPGANGLILLPYFSGERTPIHDPHAKGVLFGLNVTHTRGDVYRALLEGIAFGTNHVIDAYDELGHRPERLLAVGGGVKNAVWSQATSDISGVDQVVREQTMGASFGDAFLAALAVGDAKRAEIDAWNPTARAIEARAHPVYARGYQVYRALYENTKSLMRAIEADA